ncbi:MAG: PIN domain-containing protein [Pseudomonadota bacterium]|nr:PIN domain-containing protein [Pseudomonadota bacterium]
MPPFLDSNVVLYALGDDEGKRRVATALLEAQPVLSTQVLNECSHVLRRKLGWTPGRVAETLSSILVLARVVDVGLPEIRSAWALAERYGYSHFDCLIIAAALGADCPVLYTEDVQSDQVVDNRLKIVNPFLPGVAP